MASAVLTPTTTSSFCVSSLCSPFSSLTPSQTVWSFSGSVISVAPQNSNIEFFKSVPQLGLCQFTLWNGLKNLGISTSQHLVKLKLERKGQRKGKGVYASLFGVGAPEALVIGVVALLVFGPKGLAEVARNLGKTLRAFQPTIRELQEVSREFKSTLEKEIGIDDIKNLNRNTFNSSSSTSSPPLDADSRASQPNIDPNGSPTPAKAYSSEELLTITEEQLNATVVKQLDDSASPVDNQAEVGNPAQQRVEEFSAEIQTDVQTPPQVVSDGPQKAASATPNSGKPGRDT